MKCAVCGCESGKYYLCRACNAKKEKGEIVKCEKCGKWHYKEASCPVAQPTDNSEVFLYALKNRLISENEQSFYEAIKLSVPEGYFVFPQINLAAFIEKTDNSRFHNELFRNVDFLITDKGYKPVFAIEINDNTHLNNERQERDKKVRMICEEAGIPILNLWTSYGVNADYIKKKITETLEKLPVERKHNFNLQTVEEKTNSNLSGKAEKENKKGCYIATCVYGSYDCPSVWVLRRYRDFVLSKSIFGRLFIKLYYAFSPTLVKLFGSKKWFKKAFGAMLDLKVKKLRKSGFESTPYAD